MKLKAVVGKRQDGYYVHHPCYESIHSPVIMKGVETVMMLGFHRKESESGVAAPDFFIGCKRPVWCLHYRYIDPLRSVTRLTKLVPSMQELSRGTTKKGEAPQGYLSLSPTKSEERIGAYTTDGSSQHRLGTVVELPHLQSTACRPMRCQPFVSSGSNDCTATYSIADCPLMSDPV